MADLYDELLKATDNLVDITFSRFGTITSIDNDFCTVKEEEQDIIHQNVPILNKVTAKVGDKVVLGFVDNSLYNPIVLGNLTRGNENVEVDSELSVTSTNPVQNKVITGALNGKANSSHSHSIGDVSSLQSSLDGKSDTGHTHTKSQITDFPTIPSKTSDLTNDGDGSNVFVKDNDSRLSDARTPTNHTHGDLTNDGKITTTFVEKDTNDFPIVADNSDNKKLKRGQIYTGFVWDNYARQNIGTSAQATQTTINNAIDIKIGELEDTIPSKTSDLTNDGDGSNVFVKDNDSRLSDTRNPKMTKITSGDLNNYTNAGFYYCNFNTQAESILNRPSKVKAFYLQVENWGSNNNVKQTISSYHQDAPSPFIYVRTKNGDNVWSTWRQIHTYDEPKYLTSTQTLTSTKKGAETLELSDGYFFQNKNTDWVITGQIKVSGEACRFELQFPGNTDANNHLSVGKNTNGNFAIWWSTSSSAEQSHVDANVTFNNDVWYDFSILKRGNTVTVNFNNTKHHEFLPTYFNGLEYVRPHLRKWSTSNISVQNLTIRPHLHLPLTDVASTMDYNDYKKEGKYLIWNAKQTGNTNAPDTQGGLLEVEIIPNGVKQTLTQYYMEDPKIYYRIFHSTAGWREWKEIIITSDVVNNLTSTSTTAPLSANQGKVLKDSLVWKTQALTNMTGCTLYYNDLFCVLQVNGSYTINTKNAYKALVSGTIPSGFRPSVVKTEVNDGTVFIRVKVTEDGALQYISPQTFSSSEGIRVEFIWKR